MVTEPAGVPVITGGRLVDADVGSAAAVTVMSNIPRKTTSMPSLTESTMSAFVPTLPARGVPEIRPVSGLKFAQDGRFTIENLSTSRSTSVAFGTNA